jgi:hypothetical protein
MTSPQKQAAVNLVLGGIPIIMEKPSGDQNVEIITFGVDNCAVMVMRRFSSPMLSLRGLDVEPPQFREA